MPDASTTISELKAHMRRFIHERDWNKYHHPKELAISIAIEAAELMEVFQWDEKMDVGAIRNDRQTMKRIEDEVADVLMYVLSLANRLDMDLSDAVLAKLAKVRTKYDKDVVRETGAYRKDKL